MDNLVNIKAFDNFLNKNFDGNITKAAKEIGISKSTICLLRKGDRDIGKVTLLKLKNFCKKNNVDVKELLFF